MSEIDYHEFEKKIGYDFADINFLKTAFVHRSAVNETKSLDEHNERLEFLGDAVLELLATDYLFKHFPDKPEGEMTAIRSALVRGERLAEISVDLEAGKFLKMSRGERASGGAEKPYLLANVVEAILGAIYLDGGFEPCHKFFTKFIEPKVDEILAEGKHIDPKSHFQELAQARFSITPIYKLISEKGPDHEKVFEMGAYVGKDLYATGRGGSKKEAETDAARAALEKMN